MKCPHGFEVGGDNDGQPEIIRCRLGFPGCHCFDDLDAFDSGERTDTTVNVHNWWRNPPM